jgi:hypothetical protein
MKIIKVLYWLLYNSYVLSQNIRCKNGEYYCNDKERCITKGVICKSKCDICIEKQKYGQNIACINQCNNEVDHLTSGCILGYYDHDNNKSTPCEPVTDCLAYTWCENGYEVIKRDRVCNCVKKDCDFKYVCPYTKVIKYKDKLINGYTTYEISLKLKDDYPFGNIYAMYGDNNHHMSVPPAYQIKQHVGVNLGGINPVLNDYVPEANYDSWLTIGVYDSDIDGTVTSIGVDFDNWDENHGITVSDGAIFLLDPDLKLSKTNTYIMGHLTLKDSKDYTMNINVQGQVDTRVTHKGLSYTENNIKYNFKKIDSH